MKTTVWVTIQLPGYHSWPEAPTTVEFLRHPHRHMFHFKVGYDVTDSDREVEFFMAKRKLHDLILRLFGCNAHREIDFKNRSCEMIAQKLMSMEMFSFVEVSEDLENGAIVCAS